MFQQESTMFDLSCHSVKKIIVQNKMKIKFIVLSL